MIKNMHFSPNESFFSDSLRIRGIAIREDMPPSYVDRPAGTAEHLIMCFHDSVDVHVRDDRIRCQPGNVIVYSPWTKHYFGHDTDPWSHTWMYGTGTLMDELLNPGRISTNALLPVASENVVNTYVPMIFDELSKYSPPDVYILQNLMQLFVRELIRSSQTASGSRPIPEPFMSTRRYIEAHLHRKIALPDLADRVHLSVSQFSAEFRKWFHTSPVHYVLRLRMQRAAVQLTDVNLSVSQIAYGLGYDDPLYFSKQFKKAYGASPRNYRTKLMRQSTDNG